MNIETIEEHNQREQERGGVSVAGGDQERERAAGGGNQDGGPVPSQWLQVEEIRTAEEIRTRAGAAGGGDQNRRRGRLTRSSGLRSGPPAVRKKVEGVAVVSAAAAGGDQERARPGRRAVR